MRNILLIALLMTSTVVLAQDKKITRIANITVDSVQLEAYKKLLKVQMENALQKEPGVLSYTVYEDKSAPYKLTIVEVYASNEAYLTHREAAHFKEYKSATKDMVKSLELSEVNPVFSSSKKE